MHYILPGVQLESDCPFGSFSDFAAKDACDFPMCTLNIRHEAFPAHASSFQISHEDFTLCRLEDGWLFVLSGREGYALHASEDYRHLTAYIAPTESETEPLLPLLRTALECASISAGVLSLHSACVAYEGQGLCFTAPSGVGKSTRAMSWQNGVGAQFLSGDRPSIRVTEKGAIVSGAPWDGKEQLFVNRAVPLRGICCIRRGNEPYIRLLSPEQAKARLYQQCFIPMWDTNLAATALMLIDKLCRVVPIYRVVCGPHEDAARQVRDILFYHPEQIKETEREMKIKQGFVLRNISGEHIVMPIGKNIAAFDGTIVLSEVAAFIWEKLVEGCSRQELLQDILSEFDVDSPRAEADLDALLETLGEYQVIEEAV